MTSKSAEIAEVIRLAEESGIVVVPDRIRNLHRRVDSDATAVAVIGMVKRGKSTLLNRLVGVDVSAVAATPETAATIRVMSGAPSAWLSSESGEIDDEVSSTPEEFIEFSRRRDSDRENRSGGITGDFRIPPGLVLVDTPGVGDVAADLDELYSDLDEQWIEAGCGAAIVVINPGAGRNDLELYRRALSTFPGAVEVVIKATDSSISFDDVCEYSEFLETEPEWNCASLAVPDVIPLGRWGYSAEFGPLEQMISDLGNRAAARIDIDIQFYERFIDQFIEELTQALPVDRPRIESSLRMRSDAAPQRLIVAFREVERRFTVADIDEKALALMVTMGDESIGSRLPTKKSFATLVGYARDGSSVSQEKVKELVLKFGSALSVESIASALRVMPSTETPSLVRAMPIADHEFPGLLVSLKQGSLVRDQVEDICVDRLLKGRNPSQLTVLLPQLKIAVNRQRVINEIGQIRIDRLRKCCGKDSKGQWRRITNLSETSTLYSECRDWIDSAPQVAASTEIKRLVEQIEREVLGYRARILDVLPSLAVTALGPREIPVSQFKAQLADVFGKTEVFRLSQVEQFSFQRSFINEMISSNSSHLGKVELVAVVDSFVGDLVAKQQLLVQRGLCLLWLWQIQIKAGASIARLDPIFENLEKWKSETQNLINADAQSRRSDIISWMTDERVSFSKLFAPKIFESVNALFDAIPTSQSSWLSALDSELKTISIYLKISADGPESNSIRRLVPALEIAKASWFEEAQGALKSASIRASNVHIGFGAGAAAAFVCILLSYFIGFSWFSSTSIAVGGMISSLSLLLIFGIEYSVPIDERVFAYPPDPPLPISRSPWRQVQATGQPGSIFRRPNPLLSLFAALGVVIVLIGIFTGGSSLSRSSDLSSYSSGSNKSPSTTVRRSTSTTTTTVRRSTSTTTTTTQRSSTTTTTRPSSSTTSGRQSTTTSPGPTTPVTIAPVSAQVGSAPNTGWGRYSVMVTARLTVPQGRDHRFSVSGSSAARYSAGYGSAKISLTLQIDGYFLEQPDNGPAYYLNAAGQEASRSYSYTIQLGPGTHTLELLAYPHNPSPNVSFQSQSIRVSDLGPA